MNETITASNGGPRTAAAADQYLTFFINGEEYGVDILRVQEIRVWSTPMPIPNAPSYVKGVINIRGDIVAIGDLRERLGMAAVPCSATTAVIVLRVENGKKQRIMGIVVDAMSDVTNVPIESIKPPPTFANTAETCVARGIATLGKDKMITILDVDRIFPAGGAESEPA